jgi:hypothetical protein
MYLSCSLFDALRIFVDFASFTSGPSIVPLILKYDPLSQHTAVDLIVQRLICTAVGASTQQL